jgi:hypothetical protein
MQHKNQARLLSFAGLLTLAVSSSISAQGLASYGQGTAGTGGKVPFLWASSTPRPGNTKFGITIDRGLPNATAVPFLSLQRADFVIGGVRVLIDFSQSIQFPFVNLDTTGSATIPLPLPNTPTILGVVGLEQAFIADSGGGALGFSATQGLEIRVMNYGLLIGTRSTGAISPQVAINLDTGVQSSFKHTTMTNVDIPGMMPRTRTHMMVGSGRTNMVALYDCQVFPPKFVTGFSTSGTPWSCTWNPDGVRSYIVIQTSSSGTPEVQVVWALPGAPNFGKPYPGGNIPLGTTIDALRMTFSKNGEVGVLSTLGLFGGGGELRRFDTKSGSPTYHNQTGLYKVRGQYIWDSCKTDDNTIAIAVSGLGTQVTIHLVDIGTMQLTKTFGPQGFGVVIRGMVADPRGRYLYVGNTPRSSLSVPAGVVRIDIDKSSPNYGKITNIAAGIQPTWSVYDVEVSDAGDRLYALVGTGIQTNFVGNILEYDTTTLAVLRTWSMKGLGNTYNFAIR